ncbi:hypothetical protein BDC45DRAFT_573716 [Circinella umbellata]|nr:hypothetical protein BDC45DRAFT_573716 [Circinella umbellata]
MPYKESLISGAQELACMSLAHIIELYTFASLSLGMCYILDTLCGQSWTSVIDKKIIGIQLQRGLFIYFVLVLPIVIIWGLSLIMLQNIKFVGPDTVVLYAGTYLLFNIPGNLSFAVAYMIAAYLRAQGIMRVVVYVTAFAFPVTVTLNYILVGGTSFNLGVAGASVSESMGSIILCAYTIGYSYWIVGSEGGGWGGGTRQCLHGCMPTLKLLVPSTFLQLIQIATPQLVSLVASYFGTAALGAFFILLQTNPIFLSLAFSLRHAMITRIGNLMVALFQIIGSLSYCQVGIAYGLGRQRQTAIIILFSYPLVGIPVGYFCAFTLDWDVIGLWAGMIMAEFAVTVAIFFIYTS